MSFPTGVKERALVASARHCSVCHRHKGIKVEVHHIVPEACGGSDDFDNAIVLCFDCHSDAGHYNPKHPRGTKFSPSELRRQRVAWYDIVAAGHLAVAPRTVLHARYFVCKSFDIIREISSGDMERFPVAQPHLARNAPADFLRDVVIAHSKNSRNDQEWGDYFPTIHEYLKTHPDAKQRPNASQLPYFEVLRQPSKDELLKRIAPIDAISRILTEAGVAPEDIACALAYNQQCGTEERFQEVYRMRPLWAVYLAVTNMDAVPVALDSLVCELEARTGLGYRQLQARDRHLASTCPLPQAALAPGASAVIPVAALLGPLWPDRFEPLWTEFTDLSNGRGQSVSHGDLSAAASTISVIGPAMWPLVIRMKQDATLVASDVHELNLKNVYTLSRYWECGSCPHLFVETPLGELSYLGELFARAPGEEQEHVVIVPDDAAALVLAELEDEITVIDRLIVNGHRVSGDIRLGKGDTLRIEVRETDRCTFIGHYQTATNRRSTEPWMRNQLICAFIDDCSRNLHSGPRQGHCN